MAAAVTPTAMTTAAVPWAAMTTAEAPGPVIAAVVITAAMVIIVATAPDADIHASISRRVARGITVVVPRLRVTIVVSRRNRATGERNDQSSSSNSFEHGFSPFLFVRRRKRDKVRGKL
jgi:hypothetical protein